ncbi:glycosyltransferase family 2 protein [Dysgonomonas macrotermitis]|uniref:Glycosyltransferase involved in cell wall bisynthesis n=1 Tax=Dysgonomonas macrotermitis TaxID=1346286 RepID=A0A1M4WS79_9BACT|nr:glycosyltransferase family A protein [Dysgonomonas macrotermitis]SHE84075.1 Glycosyltransferase involved in cell wall bisynthesis [Dysgonomonas macrotermitis]
MISVCIPVYNTDVTALVQNLSLLASKGECPYEIILLDDASANNEICLRNKSLAAISFVYYHQNEQNRGLAYTRNRLGQLAQYPNLLFIDSDAEIVRDTYLKTYIDSCNTGKVYFGGCVYPDICPEPQFLLRWKFGKEREEGVGKYFSCFNFFIPREIFLQYPFDDSLKQYGYEDTLFGITLQDNGVDVQFIDNPLLHKGLDRADVYLEKVQSAVRNLISIEPYLEKMDRVSDIRLLNAYKKVGTFYGQKLMSYLFLLLSPYIEANLKGQRPYLRLLDFYKLGYLCTLKTKKKKADLQC